ncbi:DUF5057 domain-containing protein [Agathobacter sp. LCP21S3_B2]|uniref:DUF5057 domain-containing protein n=1 Tax=Agathobacter sp. LCP21S3_B2 TaxID=3438734 RepID=UPI003F92D86F
MKRVGSKKKIILPIILVLTGALLTTSLVVYNNLTSVSADATFDGVTNIVKNKNDTGSTFNILELVPQKNMGTIGYLVSGQEPDDISDSALSAIVRYGAIGTDDRVKYISALKNKLASITSEQNDDSKPLYYENYEESYVQGDESWTELTLAGDEVISANTQGYSMQNVGSGNGDYDLVKYVPVGSGEASDSGKMCNQNVDYYVYLDKDNTNTKGYYNIEFKQVTLPAGQTNSDYFGVQGENGTYINKAYKLVKFTDKNNKQVDKYVYVPYDEIVNDESYYEVGDDSVVFCADGLGKYGAVLNEKEPYVRADENSGASIQSIYNFVQIESSDTYSYVGENKGTYTLKSDKNAKLDKKVSTNKIYYKGGIKSNDWFRNKVLGEDKNVKIRVQTVTPTEFDNISTDSIDMLFISESSLDGKDTSKFKFGTWNSASIDINENTAKEIYKLAISENKKLPIVIDGKIDEDIRNNINNYHINWCPNIYKLAILLSCTEQNDGEGKLAENLDSVDKNQVQFKLFTDYKNGYLRNNIYTIPPSEQNSQAYLLNNFISVITDSSKATEKDGCSEVAAYIKSLNKKKKSNGEELFNTDITLATNFSYIISFVTKKTNKLEHLSVLDVEPCTINGTVLNGQGKNNNVYSQFIISKLKKWLGGSCPDSDNIDLKVVSMSEFIGRCEDLSKYDMIYMGLYPVTTDGMYMGTLNVENGKTVYNDSSMNGLIYSNVGDIVVVSPKNGHAGLLPTDYNKDGSLNYKLPNVNDSNYNVSSNTYRGSGNDITDEKIKKLNKYLSGNHPIVFDYGFFDDTNESKVNTTYIDNCSKMYKFVSSVYNNDNIVKVDSTGNQGGLYDMLALQKPQIELQKQNVVSDTKKYVELESNNITLKFNLNSVGDNVNNDKKYKVRFYIDSNLDGKFSDSEEIIDNRMSMYKDGTWFAKENNEGYYILADSSQYTLEYSLPEKFSGLKEWKITVSDSNNLDRYDYEVGFVHKKASKKTTINILQINCNNDNYISFEEVQSGKNEDNYGENTSYFFLNLLKEVDDYTLKFKTLAYEDPNQYAELKNLCSNDGKGLENYDIILLGYGEHYNLDNSDGGIVTAIKNYIDKGKAVVVTHDTTSYYNYPDNNAWGCDLNKVLRSEIGMDRYGVTENYSGDSADIPYLPKSADNGAGVQAIQKQGFTYADLNEFQECNWTNGHYRLYYGDSWGKNTTNRAERVNVGQITMYPFSLSYDNLQKDDYLDSIRVIDIDGGDYQLDLNSDANGDGETDLVVWYTLSPNGRSTQAVYEKSRNDVRNNYYIYTMGNITYCGNGVLNKKVMGYQSINDLQVLINSIVAAYDASPHAPEISIREGYDPNSAEVNTINLTLDDAIAQDSQSNDLADVENSEGKSDFKKDVYFTVNDTNRLAYQVSTKIHTKFYIECNQKDYKEGNSDYEKIVSDNGIIYLKTFDYEIFNVNQDGSSEEKPISPDDGGFIRDFFDNGKTYKLSIPVNILSNGRNSIKVYAVAYSEICKMKGDNPTTINTSKTYKSFDIRRLGLADLD